MSSYTRSYLSQLASNPFKQQMMTTMLSITLGIFFIAAGSILLVNQKTIDDLDNTKTSDTRKIGGWIYISIGTLIILYTLYSIFRG